MEKESLDIDDYCEFCTEEFRFLEEAGFRRAKDMDAIRPMYGTLVYLGKHVGFTFNVDLRDQCMDARVVMVVDGEMKQNLQGGYSSDVFGYLVKYRSYRGGPSGIGDDKRELSEDSVINMIRGTARLIRQFGQSLLDDRPDSLPHQKNRRAKD